MFRLLIPLLLSTSLSTSRAFAPTPQLLLRGVPHHGGAARVTTMVRFGLPGPLNDLTYSLRANQFGFATEEEIKKALASPSTESGAIILDVRTQKEIDEQGEFDDYPHRAYCQDCTLSGSPTLENEATCILPDKNKPVVVHCASGKRAMIAKECLEKQGYTTVLNAGGLQDLRSVMKEE